MTFRCRTSSTVAVALLTAAVSFAVAGGTAQAKGGAAPSAAATTTDVAPVPNPTVDPFYAQPTSFGGKTHGTVLDSRPVTVAGPGMPFESYQVKYVSTNTFGAKQADVATVLKPLAPSATPKLVAYEVPIDSLSYNCDSSYKLRMGTEREVANVVTLLTQGWTVVVPDFLGPNHQWTAGYVEGRGTLDAIRAAERFAPAGLVGRATPVGLTGYSGGARGAEFANELASAYTPELNIVGAAPGGLAVDIGSVLRAQDGGVFAGVYFAAFMGLGRAYPSIGVDALLNTAGKQMQKDISSMCIEQYTATYVTQKIESYTVNGVDPLTLTRFTSVLSSLRGGQYGKPKAPTHLYIAANDELIVPANDDKLVAQYCAAGLTVEYVKLPGDHVTAQDQGFPGAVSWLADRFAGKPAPDTC